MKKIFSTSLIALMLISMMLYFTPAVFATTTLLVTPSSAYVGTFRTILIDVYASDTAPATWETAVWAENVPTGVYINFNPSSVYYSGTIESTMSVYAGPSATPGTYSITVAAGWTTAITGYHWETRTTFTLQVKAVPEGDWTPNPLLQLQNPPNPSTADKWYPGVLQWYWPTGAVTKLSNSATLYADWNSSGVATVYASSTADCLTDQVAHLIQGSGEGVYQPAPVTMNPSTSEINLKAVVYSTYTIPPGMDVSWTGMKFDVWATDTKDNRKLYLELYFSRTGANTLWSALSGLPGVPYVSPTGNEVLKVTGDTDDYMADITANEAYNQYTSIIPTNTIGGANYSLDLSGFFQHAASLCQSYSSYWGSGRSLADYNLTQVAICVEASKMYPDLTTISPTCWVVFGQLEVKGSYLADVNLDGKVDGRDIAIVAKSFGTKVGDPLYLPNADINLDGKVDGRDIALVAKFFGSGTFPS